MTGNQLDQPLRAERRAIRIAGAPDYQGTTQTLRLDVDRPHGDGVTNRPAIVWVHGGSFCCGDKDSPEIVDEATTFAKKGFVNVSIDYRLHPTGCTSGSPPGSCIAAITDAMHDAQAAVRFLRANASTYGVDPLRIAIAGTSAGAVTALNVGFNPDDPGSSGNPGPSSAVRGAVAVRGQAHRRRRPRRRAQPLVPRHRRPARAVRARDGHRAAGTRRRPRDVPHHVGRPGHVPYGEHRQQILDTTTNFLYRAMDLAHASR